MVVVGNKVDLLGDGDGDGGEREESALRFIRELIPYDEEPEPSVDTGSDSCPTPTPVPNGQTHTLNGSGGHPMSWQNRLSAQSKQPSSSKPDANGTITSTKSGNTIYHTPSSSFFEAWTSNNHNTSTSTSTSTGEPSEASTTSSLPRSMYTAREHSRSPQSSTHSQSRGSARAPLSYAEVAAGGAKPNSNDSAGSVTTTRARTRRGTGASLASASSTAPTITPSIYKRYSEAEVETGDEDSSYSSSSFAGQGKEDRNDSTPTPTPTLTAAQPHPEHLTPPLEKGPRLFLASAKTGEGVSDIFTYVAMRTLARAEWMEYLDYIDDSNLGADGLEAVNGGRGHDRTVSLIMDRLGIGVERVQDRCCT